MYRRFDVELTDDLNVFCMAISKTCNMDVFGTQLLEVKCLSSFFTMATQTAIQVMKISQRM